MPLLIHVSLIDPQNKWINHSYLKLPSEQTWLQKVCQIQFRPGGKYVYTDIAHTLYIKEFSRRISCLHCWCSGIMQDSHSCDPGSIPGQCTFSFSFFSIACFFFPLVPVGTYHRSPLQMYSGRWTKNTYSVRTSLCLLSFPTSLPLYLPDFSYLSSEVNTTYVPCKPPRWPWCPCSNHGQVSSACVLHTTQDSLLYSVCFLWHNHKCRYNFTSLFISLR